MHTRLPIVIMAGVANLVPMATTPTTTAPPAAPTDLMSAWGRVSQCESGSANFDVYGYPAYPNSLGINATNWAQFGGTSDVSPAAQIAVAERFRAYYGIPIPDQNGCAAW